MTTLILIMAATTLLSGAIEGPFGASTVTLTDLEGGTLPVTAKIA